MKYCHKCGNPMEDEMLFCQRCGTKFTTDAGYSPQNENSMMQQPQYPHQSQYPQQFQYNMQPTYIPKYPPTPRIQSPNTMRTSMLVWMIICVVFGGIYVLIGITAGIIGMAVGMSGFFGVLAVMFFVLAKSPKGNLFLLGKQNGLQKSIFVVICVAVAFMVIMISAVVDGNTSPQNKDTSGAAQSVADHQKDNDVSPKSSSGEIHSLSDIQKWYESQMPSVNQKLIEYAQSVDGISNLNVIESRFNFGENSGWYNCHYTILFTCKINGTACSGEARAFMKYDEDTANWYHFEIWNDSELTPIVEHYDDSYEQIIEDYYKELESLYK